MAEADPSTTPPKKVRWWLAVRIVLLGIAAIIWAQLQRDWPYQKRNLISYQIAAVVAIALLVWWTFLSRARTALRSGITVSLAGLGVICALLFRLRGMTGDMVPIIEFRWARHGVEVTQTNSSATNRPTAGLTNASFSQFLGQNRDGVIPGTRLDTNWTAHPPQILWRQKVGAAWSGFAVVDGLAITQEQRGDDECVVAYELATGKQLWLHADKVRYRTTIGGEGPRATPTIVSNQVFTLGATGLLNCFDLVTGRKLWSRDVIAEVGGKPATWGCAASPLWVDGLVIVHGGDQIPASLVAFDAMTGKRAWVGGGTPGSYVSPVMATLADERQVLAFNDGTVSAHNPTNGATLWEKAWGNGNVVCASPIAISSNGVLYSSGYGVGAELLEISRTASGKLSVKSVWKSIRLKAKFAHIFARDGFVYGLDDGVFACVDLRDGSQRWKEGRYGHGQGLLVGDNYLLMSEPGELVLLQPTPDAPNERARFGVFDSKTWNPPALAGDLLLVRNDREAACLRLNLAP